MAISTVGSSSLSSLTQTATSAAQKSKASKLLQAMDTDRSGSVSKSEFVAFGEAMKASSDKSASAANRTSDKGMVQSSDLFTSVDANGDSSLSVDELSAMVAQAETQGAAKANGRAAPPNGAAPPPGGAPPPPKSGSADSGRATTTSDPADTNGDGTVSASEQLIYEMTHPDAAASTGT